jgi:hypothetical protein
MSCVGAEVGRWAWTATWVREVITRLLAWADAVQRKHGLFGFPYAVIKKYGDDDGGRQAALITYDGIGLGSPPPKGFDQQPGARVRHVQSPIPTSCWARGSPDDHDAEPVIRHSAGWQRTWRCRGRGVRVLRPQRNARRGASGTRSRPRSVSTARAVPSISCTRPRSALRMLGVCTMTQLPTMAHRTGGIRLRGGLPDCPAAESPGDILCLLFGWPALHAAPRLSS